MGQPTKPRRVRVKGWEGDGGQALAEAYREIERLGQDNWALRGALGYEVPGEYDGRLSDGSTPICGLCNARWREIERLKDQVENLMHRMTSEEAATEIERLRAQLAAEREGVKRYSAKWRDAEVRLREVVEALRPHIRHRYYPWMRDGIMGSDHDPKCPGCAALAAAQPKEESR